MWLYLSVSELSPGFDGSHSMRPTLLSLPVSMAICPVTVLCQPDAIIDPNIIRIVCCCLYTFYRYHPGINIYMQPFSNFDMFLWVWLPVDLPHDSFVRSGLSKRAQWIAVTSVVFSLYIHIYITILSICKTLPPVWPFRSFCAQLHHFWMLATILDWNMRRVILAVISLYVAFEKGKNSFLSLKYNIYEYFFVDLFYESNFHWPR